MGSSPIGVVLCVALNLYFVIVLIRIILSWVPSPPEPVQPLARGVRAVTEPLLAPLLPVARFVRALTDPLLLPLRGTLPPVQMGAMAFDLSPLILFFGVSIIRQLLCNGV